MLWGGPRAACCWDLPACSRLASWRVAAGQACQLSLTPCQAGRSKQHTAPWLANPLCSTLPCTRGVFRTSAIMGLGPPVGDGVFGFQARLQTLLCDAVFAAHQMLLHASMTQSSTMLNLSSIGCPPCLVIGSPPHS